MKNFTPKAALTANAAVTAVTGDVTITASDATAALLTNIGTQDVFWKYGTGAASLTTSTPILANTQYVIWLPPGETKIAAIASGAGSTLYVTPGLGG